MKVNEPRRHKSSAVITVIGPPPWVTYLSYQCLAGCKTRKSKVEKQPMMSSALVQWNPKKDRSHIMSTLSLSEEYWLVGCQFYFGKHESKKTKAIRRCGEAHYT